MGIGCVLDRRGGDKAPHSIGRLACQQPGNAKVRNERMSGSRGDTEDVENENRPPAHAIVHHNRSTHANGDPNPVAGQCRQYTSSCVPMLASNIPGLPECLTGLKITRRS